MDAYISYFRRVCGCVSVEQLVNAIWQKSNEAVEAVDDGGMISAKNCADMLEGYSDTSQVLYTFSYAGLHSVDVNEGACRIAVIKSIHPSAEFGH